MGIEDRGLALGDKGWRVRFMVRVRVKARVRVMMRVRVTGMLRVDPDPHSYSDPNTNLLKSNL